MYLLFDFDPSAQLARGWVRFMVSLRSPLVLEWNTRSDGGYDERSWKARLAGVLRKRKTALSKKIMSLGFDAVVTVRGRETSEIVLLVPTQQTQRLP